MTESIEQAIDRIRTSGERPKAQLRSERTLEVELLVAIETARVASYTEPSDSVPYDFLQARVGARLTLALIDWLIRRHPRVTRSDREGPSAWTGAALGGSADCGVGGRLVPPGCHRFTDRRSGLPGGVRRLRYVVPGTGPVDHPGARTVRGRVDIEDGRRPTSVASDGAGECRCCATGDR